MSEDIAAPDAVNADVTTDEPSTILGTAGADVDDATAEVGADAAAEKDGEGKPEDKPEDKAESDEVKKAPEKYEFTLDEGVELDTEALEVVEPILRELDLDNDQANKLAKAWPGLQQKMMERFSAASEAAVMKQLTDHSKEWQAATRADPEIGGDPKTIGPKLKIAASARDQFTTPELRELLETTRLGDHPEVIRLFFKVGQAISEPGFVVGDAAASTDKPTKSVLWPDMKPGGA